MSSDVSTAKERNLWVAIDLNVAIVVVQVVVGIIAASLGLLADQVKLFIESVHAQLDDSPDADNVRNGLVQLRRDFCGHDDPGTPVSDYVTFKDRLARLHYLELEKALDLKV